MSPRVPVPPPHPELRPNTGPLGFSPFRCRVCMRHTVFSLLGRMFIFYGNKTSTQFLSFTPTLICSDDLQTNILGLVSSVPPADRHLGLRGGFWGTCFLKCI